MMVHLAECIGIGASYYNLAFAVIVLILYIYLMRLNPGKIFMKPWRFIFAAFLIYLVEETVNAIEVAGLIKPPAILFPIFEFFIIILFLYAFLTMREHVKGAAK